MQKAGGYSYSPEEREFAATLQRSIGSAPQGPGPESVRTDKSEGPFPASGDPSDVIWVAPTGQLMAATYVPGVTSHTWQATACAGSTIGRKGMLVAARTLALAGVELFENPAIVQAARTAFDKRLKGRTWTTRIGPGEKPPIN